MLVGSSTCADPLRDSDALIVRQRGRSEIGRSGRPSCKTKDKERQRWNMRLQTPRRTKKPSSVGKRNKGEKDGGVKEGAVLIRRWSILDGPASGLQGLASGASLPLHLQPSFRLPVATPNPFRPMPCHPMASHVKRWNGEDCLSTSNLDLIPLN